MPKVTPYLTFRQAAQLLPGRPHVNTVGRWGQRGVYGIRLETIRLGGRRFTTEQWIDEFLEQLVEVSPDSFNGKEPRKPTARKRVTKELAELGIKQESHSRLATPRESR